MSFGELAMIPYLQNKICSNEILHSALCEHCFCEIEDSSHALWGCQGLKEIWWEVEQRRPFLSEQFANFRD